MKKKIDEKNVNIKNIGDNNIPENFTFPSIGIEDIDRAVFNLFEERINIQTGQKDKSKKVPVIFASGERFSLTRRQNPVRDTNNANIIPLISITRSNLDISPNQNGKKTAIAYRPQPNYTIKYRLSEKDRNYQNIINKQSLKNQDNVNTNTNFFDNSMIGVEPGKFASRRDTKNIVFSKDAYINLKENINTNIYEIIQTNYPYFISMTYNVVFWAQYIQQANEMIEHFISEIDYASGDFAIKTKEGFELVAFVGSQINFENNFDNMTDDERLIKYSFDLTVPGYLINNDATNISSPVRSFTSAPVIDFSYGSVDGNVLIDYRSNTKNEKIVNDVLTDITNLDNYKNERGESNEIIESFEVNPFTNKNELEYLRVKNKNIRTGETILSGRIFKEIDRQYE